MNTRRDFLYGLGASLGSVAFSDLLAQEAASSPLAPQAPQLPTKAKRCIMLFMEGGPSQVDTFDPKPELNKRHLKHSSLTQAIESGDRFFVGSPFGSRKVGQAGIDMCDQFVHMADPEVADELCVYRGCQAESLNHPEALFHMNTGSRLGGDPGLRHGDRRRCLLQLLSAACQHGLGAACTVWPVDTKRDKRFLRGPTPTAGR